MRIWVTFLLALTLTACTATETPDTENKLTTELRKLTTADSNIALESLTGTDKYIIGYAAIYSEIYAQFQGSGADQKALASLKQMFSSDPYFQSGYARHKGFEGWDNVIGLTECLTTKDSLTFISQRLAS